MAPPTRNAVMATDNVEKIMMGHFCSLRSLMLMCIPAAKSKKFNIMLIKTVEKSNPCMSLENSRINSSAKILFPNKIKKIENINAMTITPIELGSRIKR